MVKVFYVKHFTVKQTKCQCLENLFSKKKKCFLVFFHPKIQVEFVCYIVFLSSCFFPSHSSISFFSSILPRPWQPRGHTEKAMTCIWACCQGHSSPIGMLLMPWHALGACCYQGQITSLSSSCFFPPFLLFHFFLNSFLFL